MSHRIQSILNRRKKYLQVALNGSLQDTQQIISHLPRSERIIVEAGTPFIKRYGEEGIRRVRQWYGAHLSGGFSLASVVPSSPVLDYLMRKQILSPQNVPEETIHAYVVADLKTMDRGETEVRMAAEAGASAAVALGSAPTETLNEFVKACEEAGIDAMIDMMNVEYPLAVLRELKKIPAVVILHRGVDEELNKEKQIPLHEIRRIKGAYDIMIAIAGGDTIREVQRAIFNDADIVVIWKSVYQNTEETTSLVEGFLKEIR